MKTTVAFSIIIPTFKEAENIPALVNEIAHLDSHNQEFEVILMDDNSEDGSIEIVKQLQSQYSWLKIVVRKGKKGLSRSVIEGFKIANHPIIIIMDADLSHPPEKIVDMVQLISNPDVDMVIGSRYIKGGSVDKFWPLSRILISRCAAFLTKNTIGTHVKDPLSGFLAIRKNKLHAHISLNPISWKIGLEMIVKYRLKNIQEIPIHFAERRYGSSKLTTTVTLKFLYHLLNLAFYKCFSRNKPRTSS